MSPPHHLLGSQAFLPALLSYIRTVAAPVSLPLDHVIFQSILLCLIAGDKHLILRTPEEDIGLVVRLALWTLSIFNLSTHKLKIRSPIDTSIFLRSLFLPAPSQDEGFSETSGLKNVNYHRQGVYPRPPTKHRKIRSSPNTLEASTHGSSEPLLMSGSDSIPEFLSSTFTASDPVLRPGPVHPNEPARLPHSYSDPLPARRRRPLQSKLPLQLPDALVISGFEYATDFTQRTFANVLAQRQIVLEKRSAGELNSRKTETDEDHGTWNLPDGFMTVYVCPLNTRERPPIHKTLLDKFAMSTNIFITQEIRHDFRALSFTPSSRPFHPNFPSHSNPGTPSPSHPMSLPQTFTPPTFTNSLPLRYKSSSHFSPPPFSEDMLPPSFLKTLRDACHKTHFSHTLSLYLADIFSATRHNSRLDATLLTQKAGKDAEALIRASRVIGTDLTGMELLRPVVRADDFSDAGSQKGTDARNMDEDGLSPALDVSEIDVARIAPRVISHRVRVRDGPQDEVLASALYGATFQSLHKGTTDSADADVSAGRLTVKGLLVQILSEV